MKQNDTVMNIRIATELHDQLKALAKKKYMPLSVMVRLALIDYIAQEAPHALVASTQPDQPRSKPMSIKELKFIREQQMRGADMPTSPSQRNPNIQLTPEELADWDY